MRDKQISTMLFAVPPDLIARAKKVGWKQAWSEMRRGSGKPGPERLLSPDQKESITARFRDGETISSLAKAFDVSRSTVRRAL
jgi:DNA invertase Pin-like site-specific DNA recombinase